MKFFSYEDALDALLNGETTEAAMMVNRRRSELNYEKTGDEYHKQRFEYLQRAISTYRLIQKSKKAKK